MTYSANFAEKIKFEKTDKVTLYYGKNELGMEFFCYIVCGLNGYQKMQNDYLNNVAAQASSYGEVIYQDFIPEPDEKAKEFLKKYLAENS